jgi:uncharacterized protein (TIGR03435 family)
VIRSTVPLLVVHHSDRSQKLDQFPPELWTTSTGTADRFTPESLDHLHRNPHPIGQPVLDRTGIKGVYDITLKSAARAIVQPDGPSLFTLIQEQLGLKLIATKDMIPVLVVDHAEEPSPN